MNNFKYRVLDGMLLLLFYCSAFYNPQGVTKDYPIANNMTIPPTYYQPTTYHFSQLSLCCLFQAAVTVIRRVQV